MTNPMENLLAQDDERVSSARAPGEAHANLAQAVEAYRSAWKRAKAAGRTSVELTRAGFPDVSKLPRMKTSRTSQVAEEE